MLVHGLGADVLGSRSGAGLLNDKRRGLEISLLVIAQRQPVARVGVVRVLLDCLFEEVSGSGIPSWLAPSGFTLSATGVEGDKSALFFFGWNGRQANSWGNGTSYQCVVPPVKRAGVLAKNRHVPEEFRKALAERGLEAERLIEYLAPIEPITFASRARKSDILMVNAEQDEVVPPESTRAYWEALGQPQIVWYPSGHESTVVHIFQILDFAGQKFSAQTWQQAS